MVTAAGRWTDVTWVLHQDLAPGTPDPLQPAQWLEARSPDPGRRCCAGHQDWATELAAGDATALAVHGSETAEEPPSSREAPSLRDGTFVVAAGQLSEWVLDDIEHETSDIRG